MIPQNVGKNKVGFSFGDFFCYGERLLFFSFLSWRDTGSSPWIFIIIRAVWLFWKFPLQQSSHWQRKLDFKSLGFFTINVLWMAEWRWSFSEAELQCQVPLGGGEENTQYKLGFYITSYFYIIKTYLYIIKTYLFPSGTLVLGHTTVLVQLPFPGTKETPPKFQLFGQFQFLFLLLKLFMPLHPG